MSEERSEARFYTVLVVIAVVLFAVVVRPFAEALFLAAVIAGAVYPLQRGLSRKLRGRRTLSAIIVTLGVVVIILGPTVGIAAVLVKKVIEGGRFVLETMQDEGVMGLVEKLPEPMREVIHDLLERAPIKPEEVNQALREKAMAQQMQAAQTVRHTLSATGAFALQASMMVIALFFLLIDGPSLVQWCERASPLRSGQTTELLLEFRNVAVSVITSSLATGMVQTIAALIGYLIAGVPQPWFFTVMTFFMSFIPAIGAGGVCLAASLFLLAQGKIGMAIFLAVWGVVTVGLSDNLVKPLLARRGTHMHGAVVFFALVGGLVAFGTIGLILGPLIVSFLLTLVRLRERRSQEPVVLAPTSE